MNPARIAFAVVAWLFVAGVVLQVLFAGAALFGSATWDAHVGFGWLLPMIPVLMLIIAAIGRFERRLLLPTIVLTVAAMLQPELAAARNETPLIAAFHPLNAMLVFWLGLTVARRSVEQLRSVPAGAEI